MRPQKLHEHQQTQPNFLFRQRMFATILALAILCSLGFTSLLTAPSASAKEIQQLPREPNNPIIHQVYFNTTVGREYIYNGQEWVPHDASIDTYVLKKYKKPHVEKKSSNNDTESNKK
jgi:hypothetical protein